jgi:hypothetical protein
MSRGAARRACTRFQLETYILEPGRAHLFGADSAQLAAGFRRRRNRMLVALVADFELSDLRLAVRLVDGDDSGRLVVLCYGLGGAGWCGPV